VQDTRYEEWVPIRSVDSAAFAVEIYSLFTDDT